MNDKLMETLTLITEEEKSILTGRKVFNKEYYTENQQFVFDRRKLLEKGELIRIRTHTRFVDFPVHKHNYIEMMYVCKGSITHIINKCEVKMNEGDILLLGSNTHHAVKASGEGDIGINFIILPEFFDIAVTMLGEDNILADFVVGFLRQSSFGDEYLHFELKHDIRVENLIENLTHSLLEVRDKESEIEINKYTMGLLFMCLLRNVKSLRQDAPNNYEDVMMRSVIRYIDQHYKSARLTELAENMNQTLSSMSRFIKSETGSTFKELLQRKRFQIALGLLCDTNLSVNDIIAAVGYENNSYFHRRFLEKYHMSPGEYRQHNRGETIRF